MTTEDFVCNFRIQKDRLLDGYVSDFSETAVGAKIRSMHLNPEQTQTMRRLLDDALTDTFYTILLGLDGCACIGDLQQQNFWIQSEDGSVVCCGDGEVEGLAYKYFQDDAA